jgi:hypothetical protein
MFDGRRVRPFDWRDLFLVKRLQTQGQVLDYERAKVDGISPLREAVRTYLLLGMGSRRTLVMPEAGAFAQYICYKDCQRVHLTYMSPTPTHPDVVNHWVDLLEQLTTTVGEHGTQHIVAEASYDGPEMEALQRAGFRILTRQLLLCRMRQPAHKDLSPLDGLRSWRPTDDWGLRLLYTNTVPQLAQQIEIPIEDALSPSRWPKRLVLEQGGELTACLVARQGRSGSALRLLLHPQADVYIEALIRHGLSILTDGDSRPVYCRIRRYESWLQGPLEASGFEPVVRTALLVKHTTARVKAFKPHMLPLVEVGPKMTTPMAHTRLSKPTGTDHK